MTLVTFILILVIGGLCFYLLETYVPLPAPVITVLRVVGVLVLIFLLLSLFNVMPLPFAVK